MSRRDNRDRRCPDCQLFVESCLCALVPRLHTRTRLTVAIHYREARKPTNTGQLAARCVVGSQVVVVGDQAHPLALAPPGPHEQPLLLFPHETAVSIERYAGSPRPVALYVPDGNWRQASKMRRRLPGFEQMPCVTLPVAGASEYHLRSEPRDGGLATLEAIARALGILEGDGGPAVEAAMLAVFRVMVERTLRLRGVAPPPT